MAAPKKNKKLKGDFELENDDDDVIRTDSFFDESASDAVEEEEADDTQELNFDADYGRMSDLSDDSDDWN